MARKLDDVMAALPPKRRAKIERRAQELDCFASLAMTSPSLRAQRSNPELRRKH